ncbi:GNAT family N-acetyltransferase [Kutzneria sp. NPDC052558]|uniref:GNAT family N-acetyltransferase n=1 Tax=Kutzneria sp. NPDC052558 TaxID=3364121 RepID=UPI0037CC3900
MAAMELSTVLAERTEIGAYADFAGGAPADLRDRLGVRELTVGSARALAVDADSSGFLNRAGGFGGDTPVTQDRVAAVCDFFRAAGVAVGSIMIAPSELPDSWPEIAAELALTEGARYVKLGCAVDDVVADAPTDDSVRVGPVDAAQAVDWATTMITTFELPEAMIPVAADFVGRPPWRTFGAWSGDRVIATGSLFVNGEYANMFGGATHPDFRRLGAQSALLVARARAAKAAGCRYLVAETGAESPGAHNTSLHNMQRQGFRPLYTRTSWVWRAA